MAYFTEIMACNNTQYRVSGPDVDLRGVTADSFFRGVTYEFGLWKRGYQLPHTEIMVKIDLKKRPPFDEKEVRRETAEVLVVQLQKLIDDLKLALNDPKNRSIYGPVPRPKTEVAQHG